MNLIFSDCPSDDVVYDFYLTSADAENEVNPLVNPFVNIVAYEQTIYSRVYDELNKVKTHKSVGSDSIPNILLKILFLFLARPICHIYNFILLTEN